MPTIRYDRIPKAKPAERFLVARGVQTAYDWGVMPGDIIAIGDDGAQLYRATGEVPPARALHALHLSGALVPLVEKR